MAQHIVAMSRCALHNDSLLQYVVHSIVCSSKPSLQRYFCDESIAGGCFEVQTFGPLYISSSIIELQCNSNSNLFQNIGYRKHQPSIANLALFLLLYMIICIHHIRMKDNEKKPDRQ